MTKWKMETGGLLAGYTDGFAERLASLGYGRERTRSHLRLLCALSAWLEHEGLTPAEVAGPQLARFLGSRRARGEADLVTERGCALLLEYLREVGVVPCACRPVLGGPAGAVLGRYRSYLADERGLGERGVLRYLHELGPFVASLTTRNDGIDWTAMSSASVSRFLIDVCGGGRKPSSSFLAALRGFLRFAYLEGLIDTPLAQAVPSVASWRDRALPRRLAPEEVRQVLAHCDRKTLAGRRDYAIVTLLSRLGLRAAEVAGLGLDDVNWHAGEIVVRGKGSREEKMPLPTDVGRAIADYLSHDRPGTPTRAVFLRLQVPLRGLGPIGVTAVVYRACARAGVPRASAHVLRHSAATQMLRAGASLAEVGQTLRHRSSSATALYAKVDHASLRTLAPRWPEDVR